MPVRVVKMKKTNSWIINKYDESLVNHIKKVFNFKDAIARIIISRGLKSETEINDFLRPSLNTLPIPSMLKDLKKGAERVAKAIFNKEKIAVYGDYDADGVTACAVMYLFLKKIGADVLYYLPDRFEDGYSLNKKAIDDFKGIGVDIIITVDCGISDYELVEYGNNLGIDFIITDHHNVPKRLPPAYAVINPKREDSNFPFKEMSGVGVAFYFLIKLRKVLREAGFFTKNKEPNLREYLDLVAIGTISDMVPILGPNRVFVKYGIEEIKNSNKVGVRSLLKELNIENLDTRLITFRITPRLNAPGRMSNPKHAFELLISDNEETAKELVRTLNNENNRRQKEEEKMIKDALKMIDDGNDCLVYVLYSPEWHPGVLGIVASKLLERYNKPFFIFCDEEKGIIKGSGRSVPGFPLTEVIGEISNNLLSFGGHDMACGLSLRKEFLKDFDISINELAKRYLLNDDVCNYCKIDTVLDVNEIDELFFEQLALLEPFGKGNPEPTFLISKVKVEHLRPVGQKENHMKLQLSKDGKIFSGIGFSMFNDALKSGSYLDIIGLPKMSSYNGFKKWDFVLKDFCILD